MGIKDGGDPGDTRVPLFGILEVHINRDAPPAYQASRSFSFQNILEWISSGQSPVTGASYPNHSYIFNDLSLIIDIRR